VLQYGSFTIKNFVHLQFLPTQHTNILGLDKYYVFLTGYLRPCALPHLLHITDTDIISLPQNSLKLEVESISFLYQFQEVQSQQITEFLSCQPSSWSWKKKNDDSRLHSLSSIRGTLLSFASHISQWWRIIHEKMRNYTLNLHSHWPGTIPYTLSPFCSCSWPNYLYLTLKAYYKININFPLLSFQHPTKPIQSTWWSKQYTPLKCQIREGGGSTLLQNLGILNH